MRRAAANRRNKEEVIRLLRKMKKNQEILEKKLDKFVENQTTAQELVDATETPIKRSLLKQFVEDSDIEALGSVTAVGSTVAGGIGFTQYVINNNLNDHQKEELVEKTRTDYVTIEHLENNMLMTEFYQKSDQINLFHTEKTKKAWYNFWS